MSIVGGVRLALSTASVFPEGVRACFEIATDLGFDGIEVMVLADPATQDAAGLRALMEQFQMPVLAVHTPCLLYTVRVWGTDPIGKLRRSVALAQALGAPVVVTHPALAFQKVTDFPAAVAAVQATTAVRICVENMFPTHLFGRSFNGYRPHWNVLDGPYPHLTIDLSHCAAAGLDPLATVRRAAGRMGHLHLADSLGSTADEHLPLGRGRVPILDVLNYCLASGFSGTAALELHTRKMTRPARREVIGSSLELVRGVSG